MQGMGERLRAWRQAHGLTLREVGEALAPYYGGQAVPHNSVANHENRGPTTKFLAALVQAYPDFDVNYLLTERMIDSGAWETSVVRLYVAPEEEKESTRALIDQLIAAPFDHPGTFLTREELTTAEWITYQMAMGAALRTIARALCNDERRFRTPG